MRTRHAFVLQASAQLGRRLFEDDAAVAAKTTKGVQQPGIGKHRPSHHDMGPAGASILVGIPVRMQAHELLSAPA